MKKAVTTFLVLLMLIGVSAIAEKCFKIPPVNTGPTPEGKICARTPSGYCLWEKEKEDWVYLGRYCLETQANCKNHYPSEGPCNHLLDLYAYAKIYKCKDPEGNECIKSPAYYITSYGRSATGLDCQGHKCRGKGSFVEPVPPEDPVAL